MASPVVPQVPAALSVERLREGGRMSGVCVGPGIPVHVHWDSSRSVPCVAAYGECPSCSAGNRIQWQAFFPILMPSGPVRLLLLGARSLRSSQIESCDALTGMSCTFVRPKGRRFVQVLVGERVVDVPVRDVTSAVAVLFGCQDQLDLSSENAIEEAYFRTRYVGARS